MSFEPTTPVKAWESITRQYIPGLLRKNVLEDLVYRITKIIYKNEEQARKIYPLTVSFDPARAGFGLGAPLHLGAEKYYKETGYIK